MYQKREVIKNKKMDGSTKSLPSTCINWYPGHMVKAQNEIKDSLKLIDVVVEVLDARIPFSSQNPLVDNLVKDKTRIVVLNKSDLADISKTIEFKKYFEQKGILCMDVNSEKKEDVKKIIDLIQKQGEMIYAQKFKEKKIMVKPIYRVLMIGIPNVGKSTLINKMAGKNSARVGNKPGITVKKQWIRIHGNIDLLDTPGLLWPNLNDKKAGVYLALTGNIKQEVIDVEELACEGIAFLNSQPKYQTFLKNKYQLKELDLEQIPYDILERIGQKRGCLVAGGKVNMARASELFLEDLKSGKIGNITFDSLL